MIKTDHMTYCIPLKYTVNIIKKFWKHLFTEWTILKAQMSANNHIFLKYKFKTETTNLVTFHPETP